MKSKKIENIIIFVLIALFLASNILIRKITNLDELWNYNFASNIANGLVPYRDFNMIITPLLSILCGIILKITGKYLIIFRILNILLNTLNVFMAYKIMEQLKIKKYIRYIVLMTTVYIFKDYAMMDYNYGITLITLITVYLEIKNNDNQNIYYNFFIGVLTGLAITIKQTTGLILAIALIGYKILEVRSKDDLKQYCRLALLRMVGAIVPVLIMIIYLLISNSFYDFIDYCILGVKSFSNKVSYMDRLIKNDKILIRIFSILPIALIVLLCMYIKKKDRNSLILFIFGIANLLVLYPISDEWHLFPGIFVILIGVSYIIDNLIKKDIKFIEYFLYAFLILFTIYQVINSSYIYVKSNKVKTLHHYEGLILDENTIKNISNIDDFIENSEKQVYILDASASYYMIPINRYNKNYDMFTVGNLGKAGEDGQIENIKRNRENIKILIKNNKYKLNWQSPKKVRNWIINNMNKTGQIGIFDIYE